jgi:hypothetical protein
MARTRGQENKMARGVANETTRERGVAIDMKGAWPLKQDGNVGVANETRW